MRQKANTVMSKEAACLIKIGYLFAGFPQIELMARCLSKSERKINITTVENVMQEMYDERQNKKGER